MAWRVLVVGLSGLAPTVLHWTLLWVPELFRDKPYGTHIAPGAYTLVLGVYEGVAVVAAVMAWAFWPRDRRAGAFAGLAVVGWLAAAAACDPWWGTHLYELRGLSGERIGAAP